MTTPVGLYGFVWLLLGLVVAGIAWLFCRDLRLSLMIGAALGLAAPFTLAVLLDKDRRRR